MRTIGIQNSVSPFCTQMRCREAARHSPAWCVQVAIPEHIRKMAIDSKHRHFDEFSSCVVNRRRPFEAVAVTKIDRDKDRLRVDTLVL